MPIRITQAQLRQLINEETRRLSEAGDMKPDVMMEFDPADLGRWVAGEFDEYWDKQYDANDPSQAALGEEVWSLQVQEASNELLEKVIAAVEEAQDKLTGGEYYDAVKRQVDYHKSRR